MAKISAKLPIVATIGTSAYEDGIAIGRMVSITTTPTQNNVQLYADDALAEEANDTASVALSLNTDTVPMSVAGILFGATYTASTTGPIETAVYKSSDTAPFVGFGFIAGEMNSNVKTYKVIFYKKVKFNLPTGEYTTKGESITFGTPTLTATAYPDDDEIIWEEYNYSDADDAVTKLGSLLDWSAS